MALYDFYINNVCKSKGLTLEQAQKKFNQACDKKKNPLDRVGVISQDTEQVIFDSESGGLTYFGKQLALSTY